jgi:hypothetical protein
MGFITCVEDISKVPRVPALYPNLSAAYFQQRFNLHCLLSWAQTWGEAKEGIQVYLGTQATCQLIFAFNLN